MTENSPILALDVATTTARVVAVAKGAKPLFGAHRAGDRHDHPASGRGQTRPAPGTTRNHDANGARRQKLNHWRGRT